MGPVCYKRRLPVTVLMSARPSTHRTEVKRLKRIASLDTVKKGACGRSESMELGVTSQGWLTLRLRVRGSAGPVTGMWQKTKNQNQNATGVLAPRPRRLNFCSGRGCRKYKWNAIPSHSRIPLRIPHHGPSREKRKQQSRGRSRSKVQGALPVLPATRAGPSPCRESFNNARKYVRLTAGKRGEPNGIT